LLSAGRFQLCPANKTKTFSQRIGSTDLASDWPLTGGKLDLGPWEQIFYSEFDGKRRKRVLVKIIGE
jgi:hypothetical protein